MSLATQKPSGLANIYLDPLTPARFRALQTSARSTSGSQAGWEELVRLMLWRLYEIPPCRSSRVVLNAISRTGRRCVITPSTASLSTGANASAVAADRTHAVGGRDATPLGQPQRFAGDDPSTRDVDETGMVVPGAPLGSGAGTDIMVEFTTEDWVYDRTSQAPGAAADEILLHELVHGLRIQRGQSQDNLFRPGARQTYDTTEEFDAIVIANIYRSESKRPGLRGDHRNNLMPPSLAKDSTFATTYATQLDRLINEMFLLCVHLGAIPCRFNPIRRRLLAQGFTSDALDLLSGAGKVMYGEKHPVAI